MGDVYKQQITERIRDAINDWIEKLKAEHPDLLLTKQWTVQFPKGFTPGHIVLPVITGAKKGMYLVGEVQFLLPENLELDMDAVELVLKNEPFKGEKKTGKSRPVPAPLDVLNDLIVGLNDFLSGVQVPESGGIGIASPRNRILPRTGDPYTQNARNVKVLNGGSSTIRSTDTDRIMQELLQSPALPDWFRQIDSIEIRSELLKKTAEALLHYRRQTGRNVDVRDFFEQYDRHLLNQGTLHHYCRYKSKPVKLDSLGHCTEAYCSKKPYRAECPQATLKFGTVNPGDY